MPDELSNCAAKNTGLGSTRWSVVFAAVGQAAESEKALEYLCEKYWYPLYAFVRRQVDDAHEAQDLTQEFFATLLEKNYIGDADPARGGDSTNVPKANEFC